MKIKRNSSNLKRMIADLRKMNGGKLEWGFFDEETYDDARGTASVAEVAQLVHDGHENGGLFEGTTTPARPFFQTAVDDEENRRQLRAAIKKLQRQVLEGKITPEEKMEKLAELVKSQLKDSVDNFVGKGPSEATIAMRESRGSDSKEALIETGKLSESISAKINGSDA